VLKRCYISSPDSLLPLLEESTCCVTCGPPTFSSSNGQFCKKRPWFARAFLLYMPVPHPHNSLLLPGFFFSTHVRNAANVPYYSFSPPLSSVMCGAFHHRSSTNSNPDPPLSLFQCSYTFFPLSVKGSLQTRPSLFLHLLNLLSKMFCFLFHYSNPHGTPASSLQKSSR